MWQEWEGRPAPCLSFACSRLGFTQHILNLPVPLPTTPPPLCRRSPDLGPGGTDSPLDAAATAAAAAHEEGGQAGGSGIAFVVDAEVTGYLMMGALTPNCKKHSGGADARCGVEPAARSCKLCPWY
jgi:hypothetical protein